MTTEQGERARIAQLTAAVDGLQRQVRDLLVQGDQTRASLDRAEAFAAYQAAILNPAMVRKWPRASRWACLGPWLGRYSYLMPPVDALAARAIAEAVEPLLMKWPSDMDDELHHFAVNCAMDDAAVELFEKHAPAVTPTIVEDVLKWIAEAQS
jgi:hypothetical protein